MLYCKKNCVIFGLLLTKLKYTEMHLTPRECEKLMLFTAGELATKRKNRGVKLNYPEALAYISSNVMEAARDGMSISEAIDFACKLLKEDEVMEGVPQMLSEVQVEATFPDGTKLLSIHSPIKTSKPSSKYILEDSDVVANKDRRTISLEVKNVGDRPVQVGSHYHFYETNSALDFDRDAAYGMRLNIPSGNAIRFEAGESKKVELVEFGGKQVIHGFHNKVDGELKAEIES